MNGIITKKNDIIIYITLWLPISRDPIYIFATYLKTTNKK